MSGIGVITNPKAKRNLKRPWMRDTLERIVGDAGKVYETRSIAELPKVAEDFIDRDLDTLAVNGGDGTTHTALTHLIPVFGDRQLPRLLSLRGGTMNTISNSIRHKGVTEQILESVVKKIRENKPLDIVHQPLLKINDWYGFMWGFGIVGNFMEAYYKGTTLGPVQAIKVVSRFVASAIFGTQFSKDLMALCPAKITADGETFDMPGCRVGIGASIVEMGLGFKMIYRAYERPGYVHVRTMAASAVDIVKSLPSLFMGTPTKYIHDSVAREVVIETTGYPAYTVDGELYKDTNTFRITQGPVMRVIREGHKKPPKGIGLPADYHKYLPASTQSSDNRVEYRSEKPGEITFQSL